jgi:GWxTD domain-containing protein
MLTLDLKAVTTYNKTTKELPIGVPFMFRVGIGSGLAAALLFPFLLGSGSPAAAQDQSNSTDQATATQDTAKADAGQDPLTRPLTAKQKKANEKRFKGEVSQTYKTWLNEDVLYIITDQERQAFMQLSNDEERDRFIEAFWQRRDPTPDTPENEFKDEHYRRIAYANDHFAAGVQGWRTDRGRMYIKYGEPAEIDSHPSGGAYERPIDEGGGETSTYPFEDWRYRYIEGIGNNVEIEFVDTCMCGEYHMTLDRGEKDALLQVPGVGLTIAEQMGMANKNDRVGSVGLEHLGLDPASQTALQAKEFDRLSDYAKLQAPPQVQFKDLEEVVIHKFSYNLMPFDVQTDFVKVTDDTVLVPIAIQIKNRDVTFVNKDGIEKGVVHIFGRLTTIGGTIAQTFEDTVEEDEPAELLPKVVEQSHIYSKSVPLRPGRYRLDIVLKDVNGDRTGTWSKGILVPEYAEDRLATSSLMVADDMEPVPTRSVGTGMFVIGATKVRPRVAASEGKPATFKRNEKVNFWMQVYNLTVDDKTHKPSATVSYDVINQATNKPVIHTVEDTSKMGNVGEQLTLAKTLSAANLGPGTYRIQIKVNDNLSKQTVDPTATFVIE